MRTCSSSKWTVPVFSLAMGVVLLVAQAIGGELGWGFVSLGVMAAFGAVFALGGRSETIRGLRGDGRDERFAQIDLRASWFSGIVVLVAVLAGFVYELARGHDGNPFTWLAAIGGVSYIAAVAVQRWRA